MPQPDSGRPVTIGRQARYARSEALSLLVRMGVPWAIFVAITVMGNVLYLVIGKAIDHGEWVAETTALILALGIGLAAFDRHLRRHRASFTGRNIGAATVGAASSMTSAFLLSGYSWPLTLLWVLGGTAGCFSWDAWLAHAEHHDLSIGFSAGAEQAGLGRARLTPSRRPAALPAGATVRPRPRRPAVTGVVTLTDGATPAELAARAASLESANHWPAGSASFSASAHDGAASEFTLSDPSVLEGAQSWPGPSAPGADMSVPLRLAMRQDGCPWLYDVLPLHHMRASGRSGAGKTQSWLWSFQAEAVTREEYACFGFDIVKGMQFFGPLAPAMHGIAVTAEQVLDQYLALQRARKARLEYLTRMHLTGWQPGCGLSFVDSWMEEAPSILTAIEEASKGKAGISPFKMADWLEGIKGDRSAGMRHDASMQFGKDTEFPTVARAQFGTLCFGTATKGESRIGLSEAQLEAGARPELWGSRYPGKAYCDPQVDSADPADVAMPMRLWYWGPDARTVAAYMEQWPAEDRPLDDVTGEAMEARPPQPASYAYPERAGRQPVRPAPELPEGVTRLPLPDGHPQDARAAAAEDALWKLLLRLYAEGIEVVGAREVETAPEFKRTVGRSRGWIYTALDGLALSGRAERLEGGNRKLWRVIPARAAEQGGA